MKELEEETRTEIRHTIIFVRCQSAGRSLGLCEEVYIACSCLVTVSGVSATDVAGFYVSVETRSSRNRVETPPKP